MSSDETKRGRGRPKGARNKSKLIKAQLAFDEAAELAAETLIYLMTNDKDNLNITDDVPCTIRLQACKVVIDKAIANEKDKAPADDTSSKTPEQTPQVSRPKVLKSAN